MLAAATAVIAWRSEAAMPAVPVAAALAVLVIVHWAVNFNFEILFTPRGPFYGAPPTWTITGRGQHLLFAAGTAAVFGGMRLLGAGALRSGWNSPCCGRPARC